MKVQIQQQSSEVTEPGRTTPIVDRLDVLVAGGGTAGIIAALAAARNGAKTLVVERSGFLGGYIGRQMLEHSEGWDDPLGTRIVGGIPEEVIQRLKAIGASPGHIRDDTGYTPSRVPINHEEYKSLVPILLDEEGVEFLIDSPIVASLEDADGVAGVITENKSGRQAYRASVVVDCTGDADVAAYAGASFHPVEPNEGDLQPVSLLFKLGGVDFDELIDYVEAHPDDFKLGVEPTDLRGQDHVNLWGFGSLMRKGKQAGILSLGREELHFSGWTRTGEAVINVTRVPVDALSAKELSRAEVALRRQVLEFVQFFRGYVPGFATCYLAATAAALGVRETRRLKGVYKLTDADVIDGRRFPDAVAQGGFPIDIHDARGSSMAAAERLKAGYDIPYRCFIPSEIDQLLVGGRCLSASRKGLATARQTGTCMAMGQAVGTAAAMSAGEGVRPRDLDIESLRGRLREQGALLYSGPA